MSSPLIGALIYADGVYVGSPLAQLAGFYDIERIEVLRGPQGTLYGRNSIGGALNIIYKRPTEEFNGEVRLAGGNYGSHRVDALIRGPITDGLRYSLGGSLERRDEGYIHNVGPAGDTSGLKRYMVDGQLEADLGENITARIHYTSFNWDDSYGVGNVHESVITP